tara:strand:+ start:1594 stop:2028 length:435 start_codon:yes stop_codon:yes gene_type:complete
MIAKICRKYRKEQTEGELQIFDEDSGALEFVCKTLELPWLDNQTSISCIPEGHYDVVPRTSQKYKEHLHITDVEGRSLILIHFGNYAGSVNPKTGKPDIRGCVLVGKNLTDINGDGIKDITSSKNTFKELMKVAPDGFVLEVTQ